MAVNLDNARLTFSDDFNSFNLNTNASDSIQPNQTPNGTWASHYWWGDGMRTHGNGELQYYADSTTALVQAHPEANPFHVQDGVLTIKGQPSPNHGLSEGKPYVSGMITTEGTFSQQYGYFEMRADLPGGKGMWPAFWMLNQGHTWPPELDIVEMIGSRPQWLEMTAHTGIGGHSVAGMQKGADVGDMTTGFHTYGAMVMPDRITWYFDGQEMFSAPTPEDLKTPLYMIANLAIGGDWPGAPDGSTPFPAEMKIDYIKAWQFPGLPGYEGGTSAPLPAASPAPAPQPAPAPAETAAPAPAASVEATIPAAAPSPTTWSEPSPAPVAPAAPVTGGNGTGPDALILSITQDHYQGDAQFLVRVDGQQKGGIFTAHALRGSGATDQIELRGDYGHRPHTVEVEFLNDAYGGNMWTDRNLYVEGVALDDDGTEGGAIPLFRSATLWDQGSQSIWLG